jgi:drug/metabolite transporter (DMT)-like permease
MDGPHAGEIAALLTAFCWTATSIAFEAAGRRIGSLVVNLTRLLWAIPLLAVLNLVIRGRAWPFDAPPEAWAWLGVSGLIGFAIGDLLLFRAFVVIGARLSMLVMALVPPMTALLGIALLGERLTPREWAGMALTVAGVSWVVRERVPAAGGAMVHPSAGGVLLALGGAAGQAAGLVLSKIGMRLYPTALAANQIRVIAGTVGFIVIFFAMRRWGRFRAGLRDRVAQGQTLVGAIFGPFAGVTLSLVAVRLTEAGVAATIMALPPVLILPFSRWVRRDHVTLRATLGAILAVVGCMLLFLD